MANNEIIIDSDGDWWVNKGDSPLYEIDRLGVVLKPGVFTQIKLSSHLARQPHAKQELPPSVLASKEAEALAAEALAAEALAAEQAAEALAAKEAESVRKHNKPK